jgi:hypothetical protein
VNQALDDENEPRPLNLQPRVRWFHGQALEAVDFQDFDASHRSARARDRRWFQGHGIAADRDDSALRVEQDARDPWVLRVRPGLAFNALGQSLIVASPTAIRLSALLLAELSSERILLCLVPRCEALDFRELEAADAVESARCLETAALEVATRCPADGIELARLELSALTHQAPRVAPPGRRAEIGEWDQSHAPRCRVQRSLTESQARRLSAALGSTREVLRSRRGDPLLSELRSLCRSLELSLLSGPSGSSHWRQSFAMLGEVLHELQSDGIGSRAALRDALEALREVQLLSWISAERGVSAFEELADHIALLAPGKARREAGVESYLELSEPVGVEEDLRSRARLPEAVRIEGRLFELRDEVEAGPESWPAQLRLPETVGARLETLSSSDGSVRTARAFVIADGSVAWQVDGLAPGQDLILVARVDGRLRREAWRVYVDGVEAGLWSGTTETEGGWRHETFFVNGELVQGEPTSIELRSRHGLEIFGLWAYQAGRQSLGEFRE